jgi:hypothetical protein
MRAPTLRLVYRGTINFQGDINARVEAELLRDTWAKVLGLILTPMTKLFEYRVTGTLAHPKKEPLYLVPRLLLMPFQPFKALKELLPGANDKAPPRTPEKTSP